MLINETISWTEAVGTYGPIRVSWLQPVIKGLADQGEESDHDIEPIGLLV